MDGWPRLAEVLEMYRQALVEHGHTGRGVDVFGTLLAVADIMLHDDLPTWDELAVWGERLQADTLPELEGDIADEHYCLSHLMSQVIDPYRSGGGGRRWRNGLAKPPGGTTPMGRTRKKRRRAAS